MDEITVKYLNVLRKLQCTDFVDITMFFRVQ
jgi:hypothetical protein